ncbi:uncharacterized protein LOC126743487 [Anthonomus grandis grandis]|uniref:uncharacterized protein LOC126743487 n=1 Tax=Anthonomus grandis grandis TaxID=2921223 RepID=UPI0021660E33|nr:uncharacterized protein LOC126743487 [Anthonomus grandis grandis]
MERFTWNELADMHLTLGESRGNAVLARAIYAERFPNRMVPERRFFLKVDRSLRERGQLQVNPGIRVRARPIRDNVEEEILHNIEEDPNTSTRKIADHLRISQTLVWKVLHDNHLYPFKKQKVQHLLPQDYANRFAFATWYLQ